MATGGGAKQPPYTSIELEQEKFIKRKYLPSGMVLRQARTMKEGEIIQLFDHIAHRQERYGAEDAFRFRSFKHKVKGILRAKYPVEAPGVEESDASDDQRQQAPAKRVRRQIRSKKANRPVASDEEARGEQVMAGDGTDAASNEPSHLAKRVRRRTRIRKANRVVSTDEEAEEQGGASFDATNDNQQQNPTGVQQRVATRSQGVTQPLGSDQLLLPTPAPTPTPSPIVMPRPRPRLKQRVNPTPSRIQPSRQGKVN